MVRLELDLPHFNLENVVISSKMVLNCQSFNFCCILEKQPDLGGAAGAHGNLKSPHTGPAQAPCSLFSSCES